MDPARIEIRSGGLDAAAHPLVVVVPTFRRPEHLALTLGSLEAQTIRPRPAVVIVENDAEGLAGLAAARPFLQSGRLSGLIVVQPARGNCSAYNAGWASALAEFPEMRHLAILDDDEIADPQWAERLVAIAGALGVDMVGGPQVPVFETGTGEPYGRHPVFTPHYSTTGRVPILYSSGNVLIARRVLETMSQPFLDTAFDFIGGGDSDFYARAKAAGFTFGWCAEAQVRETTPARRTTFSWVHARSLRNGAISAMIERRLAPDRAGRLRSLGKSMLLLLASPFRGARLGFKTGSAVGALYPVQVALGRFQGAFGGVNEQYRRPESN